MQLRPERGAIALLEPQSSMCVRRCPTLPHSFGCSTIGAVGLSFRVRDGTGRFPHAMTAVTLPTQPLAFLPGVGKPCVGGDNWLYVVIPETFLVPRGLGLPPGVVGLLFQNRLVDA